MERKSCTLKNIEFYLKCTRVNFLFYNCKSKIFRQTYHKIPDGLLFLTKINPVMLGYIFMDCQQPYVVTMP